MVKKFDVIVVGTGPAGATAAYFLGEAGKKILVLEKEILPRYKICGGGLSIDFLRRQFPFSFDPIVEADVSAMRYALGKWMVTVPVQRGKIGMVMRDRLDAYILSQANVEIRQGCSVRKIIETENEVIVNTEDGQILSASFLIGADGANSVVARSIGLRKNRTLAAAIEAEVPVPPEYLRRFTDQPIFIFNEIHLGYLWIFPKANHLSVGIAALHPKRGVLKSTLIRVMERYGIRLDQNVLNGHPIPIYTKREPIGTNRVLLAGDAAGLVDPLSGEGIRYAIKSGRIASNVILSDRLETYSDLIFRKIGLDHIFAGVAAQIFYRLQSLCLILGAPNPFTTQVIVDLLSDRAKSVDVMVYSMITLPIFILTEIVAVLTGILGGIEKADCIRSRIYGVIPSLSEIHQNGPYSM